MSTSQLVGEYGTGQYPQTLHISKSFSRLKASPSSLLDRSRSSTLHDGSIAETLSLDAESQPYNGTSPQHKGDLFEKATSSSGRDGSYRDADPLSPQDQEVPKGFDELPIELVSLIDR